MTTGGAILAGWAVLVTMSVRLSSWGVGGLHEQLLVGSHQQTPWPWPMP